MIARTLFERHAELANDSARKILKLLQTHVAAKSTAKENHNIIPERRSTGDEDTNSTSHRILQRSLKGGRDVKQIRHDSEPYFKTTTTASKNKHHQKTKNKKKTKRYKKVNPSARKKHEDTRNKIREHENNTKAHESNVESTKTTRRCLKAN